MTLSHGSTGTIWQLVDDQPGLNTSEVIVEMSRENTGTKEETDNTGDQELSGNTRSTQGIHVKTLESTNHSSQKRPKSTFLVLMQNATCGGNTIHVPAGQ